jgi:hypothetical protein
MPDPFLRLLAEMSRLNLHVSVDHAGMLQVGPAGKVSSELRLQIAKHKAALIQHIRQQNEADNP